MNLGQIRADLADALGTVLVSTAANRNILLDGLPGAIVEVDTVTPATFGDGSYDVDCTVQVLVSLADAPDAWVRLDELVSSDTIADALRDADLEAEIGSYGNIGAEVEYDDGVALGFTLAVRVTA